MSESPVKVVGEDEQCEEILGQSTKVVRALQEFLLVRASVLGREFGYPETASALLGAAVNFLLTVYTVDSVREVLEGVLPNLQRMHDTIEAAWLIRAADPSNPQ